MIKRPVEDAEDGDQAYLKRQRIFAPVKGSNLIEGISSGRQLQKTLTFDQDVTRSRQGMCSFQKVKRKLLNFCSDS
jgi:hypothetical protein